MRDNFVQPGEDDVDQDAWEYLRKTRADASVKTPRNMVTRAQMRDAAEARPNGPCARPDGDLAVQTHSFTREGVKTLIH